jgi:hypothetical protein
MGCHQPSMTELVESDETSKQLLPAISAFENTFRQTNLADNIREINTNLKPAGHD